MSFPVRRVVTGHDADGKAVVISEGEMGDTVSLRDGMSFHVVWATDELPADNAKDEAAIPAGTVIPSGSVFRVIEYGPGVSPRFHRTESIDYAIVLSGEIDLELDEQVVTLRAGDVLVQRGTIHNWANRSGKPCRMAFVLISAQPVPVAGQLLGDVG